MSDVEKASTSAQSFDFHTSLSPEEREFYVKAYPTPDLVRDRKTHCTTCKIHIGTAPGNYDNVKMHPILRVTHCVRCQDFYNCGEFSKGEDGSELYCRWCGQGGEVYCCSNCPFVFCKSCITKNLSRGVVADIEQNENWRCFACAPKILWPLRALHWALMNYMIKQKKEIEAMNLPDPEKMRELAKDRSSCCRLAKAKCGNMSDSLESIDSLSSKRSGSSASKKKPSTPTALKPAKRQKTSNDEVVCTPDLLSMLEPDCQLTVAQKNAAGRTSQPANVSTTPKVFTIQQNFANNTAVVSNSVPPPLVLRNTSVRLQPVTNPAPVVRRTVVSPRTPSPAGSQSPVYHTINGYRIDLNSAAQQGTYRLPNGKLIQVKRQSAPNAATSPSTPPANTWQQQQQRIPAQITPQRIQLTTAVTQPRSFATITPRPAASTSIRYQSGMVGNTVITPYNQNGPQIQMINGANGIQAPTTPQPVQIRPLMIKHTFPNTSFGESRSQLQDQIFGAMEICQHLSGKVQTLTNSNAYKTARNYMELKELYIHLSYLLTYAIGRFKGLQDKCLGDMRKLGFCSDADKLENGQLAAGVDYVRYGQLEDVELFTSSLNSFPNQIYEYRKSLLSNMEHYEDGPQLSPLPVLRGLNDEEEDNQSTTESSKRVNENFENVCEIDDQDDDVEEVPLIDESSTTMCKDPLMDDDPQDNIDNDNVDDESFSSNYGLQRGTEDSMRREEESHAYDRKLTRLIQQYPSIWCTRHPDYGNFEITRKQWRTIASQFTYSNEIKMRWKNIRKRYVRIERRMHEGKRFNGYFDKATNFLINRDIHMDEWIKVDCGDDVDGDVYERKKLDEIEKDLYADNGKISNANSEEQKVEDVSNVSLCTLDSNEPIEIRPLDMKIIHFVKCNPVLWRKSHDPQFYKMDEQTRKSLWMHLLKSMPSVRCSDVVDRWTHLYEMYKTFRLKTIKSESALAALEIKYSKYLAKLSFLYKIEEDELRIEDKLDIYGENFRDDEIEDAVATPAKLITMPDDKEFVADLVRLIQHYPQIWNIHNIDYYDVLLRADAWQEIADQLSPYQHKQASDDEDNEIEIVEPKTDTINLADSDEETTPTKSTNKVTSKLTSLPPSITITKLEDGTNSANEDSGNLMSSSHNFLASILEVNLEEDDSVIEIGVGKGGNNIKQPRKKTTNKPNPTLMKQKEKLDRQKCEDLKQNDLKLKTTCVVKVQRVEKSFPHLKENIEEWKERVLLEQRDITDKSSSSSKISNCVKPIEIAKKVGIVSQNPSLENSTAGKTVFVQDDKKLSPFKILCVQSLRIEENDVNKVKLSLKNQFENVFKETSKESIKIAANKSERAKNAEVSSNKNVNDLEVNQMNIEETTEKVDKVESSRELTKEKDAITVTVGEDTRNRDKINESSNEKVESAKVTSNTTSEVLKDMEVDETAIKLDKKENNREQEKVPIADESVNKPDSNERSSESQLQMKLNKKDKNKTFGEVKDIDTQEKTLPETKNESVLLPETVTTSELVENVTNVQSDIGVTPIETATTPPLVEEVCNMQIDKEKVVPEISSKTSLEIVNTPKPAETHTEILTTKSKLVVNDNKLSAPLETVSDQNNISTALPTELSTDSLKISDTSSNESVSVQKTSTENVEVTKLISDIEKTQPTSDTVENMVVDDVPSVVPKDNETQKNIAEHVDVEMSTTSELIKESNK